MSDTPETDRIVRNAAMADHPPTRLAATLTVKCEKLERERDEYKQKCRIALSERDSWRLRAEQKYAIRRELEELLGVDHNEASDEQLQRGIDAIKNIMRERDEARSHITEGWTVKAESYDKLRDAASRVLVAINKLPIGTFSLLGNEYNQLMKVTYGRD